MSTKQTYTVSIYTENSVGILNRITAIFQRRHINIESINTSKSEIKEVSRTTILIKVTEAQMKKIIGQIEKQVAVIKAFYHTVEDTIYQESCLFKLSTDLLTKNNEVQHIINQSSSRIIHVEKTFFVLEKSGLRDDIEALYHRLEKYGIMQFIRSGRIAVTKEEMLVSKMLKEI